MKYNLKSCWFAASFLAIAMATPSIANAADLGGDCCADLEERVADLEKTTARKGNRKVSLTVSGQVNQALLFWDDGAESDTYVVTNDIDNAQFRFEGDAEIGGGWSAGFTIEVDALTSGSSEVNQDSDDADEIGISAVFMYLESENLGKITWGFAGQPSDGAPEMDLSGAENASYAAIGDVAGGFNWRLSDGSLAPFTLGDVFDDLNGDTYNIIRYDTPTFAGFTLSASWGENDLWDVALTYENEDLGAFEAAAAIAYTHNKDIEDGNVADKADEETIAGSISLLHKATGLNFTVAAGQREFNNSDAADAKFYYLKAGWLTKMNSLGNTAFYGEYGNFKDYLADDAFTDCAGAGVTCSVTGSEGKVYGAGIVQHIDNAHLQLYLAYRHYEMDVDAVDGGGADVAVTGINEFDTFMAGGRIEF